MSDIRHCNIRKHREVVQVLGSQVSPNQIALPPGGSRQPFQTRSGWAVAQPTPLIATWFYIVFRAVPWSLTVTPSILSRLAFTLGKYFF